MGKFETCFIEFSRIFPKCFFTKYRIDCDHNFFFTNDNLNFSRTIIFYYETNRNCNALKKTILFPIVVSPVLAELHGCYSLFVHFPI